MWKFSDLLISIPVPRISKTFTFFLNRIHSEIIRKYDVCLSIEVESALGEWTQLKQAGKYLAANFMHDVVNIIDTSRSDCYSNVQKIVLLALMLPFRSAIYQEYVQKPLCFDERLYLRHLSPSPNWSTSQVQLDKKKFMSDRKLKWRWDGERVG